MNPDASDKSGTVFGQLHFFSMKHRYDDEMGGVGSLGALGLGGTILVSLLAFWVADAGLFDGRPAARLTVIEDPAKMEILAKPASSRPSRSKPERLASLP